MLMKYLNTMTREDFVKLKEDPHMQWAETIDDMAWDSSVKVYDLFDGIPSDKLQLVKKANVTVTLHLTF